MLVSSDNGKPLTDSFDKAVVNIKKKKKKKSCQYPISCFHYSQMNM